MDPRVVGDPQVRRTDRSVHWCGPRIPDYPSSVPRITLSTVVPAPPVEVFAICLDVDMHTQSMGTTEHAIAGVTQGRLRLGDQVTWRARHLGVTWRMTVQITDYESPHRFVDEQVSGPFHHWRHEHTFTPDPSAPARTMMHDIIDFDAPGGMAGTIGATVILRPYLHRMVKRRNGFLSERLRRRPQQRDRWS